MKAPPSLVGLFAGEIIWKSIGCMIGDGNDA